MRNVSQLLQASDLLVLNSDEEPFGLVLIEAMSSGTPVVAARCGGIPEIVTDDENGWLIEKADTVGLAHKLIKLARNKEALERVARHARNVTCPKFSLQRFQSQLHECYEAMLSTESRAMERAQLASPYHQ